MNAAKGEKITGSSSAAPVASGPLTRPMEDETCEPSIPFRLLPSAAIASRARRRPFGHACALMRACVGPAWKSFEIKQLAPD
jgi:hypothetical protein